MKATILILYSILFLLFSTGHYAQSFDHSLYDSLLQKYVEDGLVNYSALHQNRTVLTKYLEKLESVDPSDFDRWSEDKKKAFWINGYNAITIEGILRKYPIQFGGLTSRLRFPQNSIRQIGGFWNTVFIRIMGNELTLDDIEHKILRKQFNDARIHFVLVCASLGCPVLQNRAFFGEGLDARLEEATKNFINDSDKVHLNMEENNIYLSSIFKWYKADFSSPNEDIYNHYNKDERAIVSYVAEYLNKINQIYIQNHKPKVKYLFYDWTLNEKK